MKIILDMPPNMKCIRCNKNERQKGRYAVYCIECVPITKRETKLRYYYKNKNLPDFIERAKINAIKSRANKKSRIIEAGKTISSKNKNGHVLWKQKLELPDFNSLYTFSIPFDWTLSKNGMKNWGGGHYYLNPNTKAAQEVIIHQVRQSKIKWIQAKLYIDILVEKPNQRGDAINFIDTIADAIVKAIGVDDRWFCISRVDWVINKNNPKIWVTMSQDTITSYQACSHCGRILSFDNFVKNARTKNGIDRACKECQAMSRVR